MNDDGEESFPTTIWNNNTTRTNNHMECFNRSLNFHVITTRASIYKFKNNRNTNNNKIYK